jgi:hypothetical protein
MKEPLFHYFVIIFRVLYRDDKEYHAGGGGVEWGRGGRKVTPYQSRVLAPHQPCQPPLAAETWTKISKFCRVPVENATFHLELYTDARGYIRKVTDNKCRIQIKMRKLDRSFDEIIIKISPVEKSAKFESPARLNLVPLLKVDTL